MMNHVYTGAAKLDAAEPVRRPPEIEDVTNLFFVHPIANRLTTFLAAKRVTPNAVSVTGMLFGILAGLAYAHYQDTRYVVAGFILMIAWHVMDGADGQLARLTHAQSQSGKFLDGICDYATFTAVYLGLAWALGRQYGDWVYLPIAVSGGCHAVQSAMYEMQRQEYGFWGWARDGMDLLARNPRPRHGASPSLVQRVSDWLHRLYVRGQFLAAGDIVAGHQRLAATMVLEPQRAAFIRRRYREIFAPSVRRWSVLSANTRTMGIFIFALFKAPLDFFWFEIIGLGLIAIILRSRQTARYDLFFRRLDVEPLAGRPGALPLDPAKGGAFGIH